MRLRLALAACLAVLPTAAFAQANPDRFSAGGYFRIQARPDFQGGNGRLGFWNLYGRLMNEGPYAALELRLDLLQAAPGTDELWASIHTRVEGGSFTNSDPANGNLINFRVSQLYVRAGNLLLPKLIWQLGTLQYFFGDLGLYDFRPAQILDDTVGLSVRYPGEKVDVLAAIGDSGFGVRGLKYVPLLTAGGAVRVRASKYFEFGGGGQFAYEPFIQGNVNSSYVTPYLNPADSALRAQRYQSFVRGEVVRRFLEENPGMEDRFGLGGDTQAVGASRANTSWRAVGYVGFGGFGPLRWSNFFIGYRQLHPQQFANETFNGRTYTLYTADLTRDRAQLQLGNEMQLRIIPNRFDVVWSVLYGDDSDRANTIQASEANRTYLSTVLRLQVYLSRVVHVLLENSLAQERSKNGNLYRSASDAIFQSTGGQADSRGLEYGDLGTRNTWQLKTGLVLNPTGFGIYARPSIRLLYGFQYSTTQAAYGNAFVERLDQFNAFPSIDRYWHHLVSLEAEGWF